MTRCPVCGTPLHSGDRDCPACGVRLVTPTHAPTEALGSTPRDSGDERSHRRPSGHGRFLPGTVVAGRYRIVERVGRGGMGEVYRADDLHLDEAVALKFLPAAFERDPGEWQRLRDEVRTARQVSHPNVCRVHDIGELDGVPFLTMEFVDGEDLASLLPRIDRLSPDKALRTAREICAGLQAIHDIGVVHRDLKPANIMIDGRGRARITDFGLALPGSGAGHGPEVAGTPGYMAPETAGRGEVSVRSDLYSLGLVLHEVFTGQRAPHANGATPARERVPAAPGGTPRRLDPAIERVLQRCLEPDPARRPASVHEVLALLPGGDPFERGAGEAMSPEEVGAARLAAMPRAWAWGCLAATLAGLVVLGLFGSRGRVVPQLALPDPPAVLQARARDHIAALGLDLPSRSEAHGFVYARDRVEHIAATDASRDRWRRLDDERPAVVRYWYRSSPAGLEPWHWRQRITPADPPLSRPGMALVEVDTRGRLERLAIVPGARAAAGGADATPDWRPLFAAAGLDSAAFHAVPPRGPAPAFADTRAAWDGTDAASPRSPLHLEAAALHGQVVSFTMTPGGAAGATADAAGEGAPPFATTVRATLLVLSFLLAAWLARRHLRAGEGDRKRAVRAASVVMGLRFAHWVLSGHPVAGDVPGQFALALAWALYDFAYMRIFYLAVEPYVRRLWPRFLVTWVRLIDGRFRDPAIGRDLLVGTAVGVAIGLGTVLHRSLPVLWGAPPGRPDNVGFVEPALQILLGTWPQLAQDIESLRSAIILALCFLVMLVVTRLLTRRAWLAVLLTFVVFVPLGMPFGGPRPLDVLFASASLGAVLLVLFRFGLVSATVALTVNALLQSTPFHGTPSHWSAPGTALQLAIVAGGAVWGLWLALGGRGARRGAARA